MFLLLLPGKGFSLNSLSLELFLFASVATVQSPPLNEEFPYPCQTLESHLPCESTLLPALECPDLSFLQPAGHWAPNVCILGYAGETNSTG